MYSGLCSFKLGLVPAPVELELGAVSTRSCPEALWVLVREDLWSCLLGPGPGVPGVKQFPLKALLSLGRGQRGVRAAILREGSWGCWAPPLPPASVCSPCSVSVGSDSSVSSPASAAWPLHVVGKVEQEEGTCCQTEAPRACGSRLSLRASAVAVTG